MADSIGDAHGTQDDSRYCFHLNNGIVLDASYGCANLLVLPLAPALRASLVSGLDALL